MNWHFNICISLALVTLTSMSEASIIVESELDGQATNNSQASAQALDFNAFSPNIDPNVFGNLPTATVYGRGGGYGAYDVDFFAFRANAGKAYFDIDTEGFPPSATVLSLFDGNGTFIAIGSPAAAGDPGSPYSTDPFLGIFELPTSGVYYIAVSNDLNFPNGGSSFASYALLTRPDGLDGGFSYQSLLIGDSSYPRNGVQFGKPYILEISVENPASVPEPASIFLVGIGLAAVVSGMRRRSL